MVERVLVLVVVLFVEIQLVQENESSHVSAEQKIPGFETTLMRLTCLWRKKMKSDISILSEEKSCLVSSHHLGLFQICSETSLSLTAAPLCS